MCTINARLCRVLHLPDDGDDNPKARRSGFSPFASIHDPEDRGWESRVLPLDPPPVAIHLPHEADAWEDPTEIRIAVDPGPWSDPDGEDESHAEEVDIRAELRAMQFQIHRDQCNVIG